MTYSSDYIERITLLNTLHQLLFAKTNWKDEREEVWKETKIIVDKWLPRFKETRNVAV